MNTYMIQLEMYKGSWANQFCITADDIEMANRKAHAWGRYHSFFTSMVRVRLADEGEAQNNTHDEYIYEGVK